MTGLDPQSFETRHREFSSLEATKPNLSVRKHAWALTAVFAVLTVLVFLLPWQQTAVGTGTVIAYSPSDREQEISAPVSGRIASWYVSEGQPVTKGEVLVDLRDIDPMLLDRLNLERDAMSRRAQAAQKAVQTAKRNMDRQRNLLNQGLSSRRDFEKAELDYMGYLAEEAEANASLARMDVKLARQLTQRVEAPADGTILKINAGQGGQIVKQGDILCILVPNTSSRTVELWLDGNDVPLVHVGRKVRLQFEGWPAIQFGGWPSVAVGTFGGQVALVDPMNSQKGKFRVFIRPDDKETWPDSSFLRQGVRANGWVLLNQVSVGYEIWRQLNGFPPSLDSEPETGDNAAPAKK